MATAGQSDFEILPSAHVSEAKPDRPGCSIRPPVKAPFAHTGWHAPVDKPLHLCRGPLDRSRPALVHTKSVGQVVLKSSTQRIGNVHRKAGPDLDGELRCRPRSSNLRHCADSAAKRNPVVNHIPWSLSVRHYRGYGCPSSTRKMNVLTARPSPGNSSCWYFRFKSKSSACPRSSSFNTSFLCIVGKPLER